MKMMGRNAIVTGGSQGLGRTIVEAYLEAGANVAFCARHEQGVQAALLDLRPRLIDGQKLIGSVADVSNAASLENFFGAVSSDFGELHILVNNAGVYGPIGPIESVDFEEWKHAFEIDIFGMVLAARLCIPGMKHRRYGKLIQISGGGTAAVPNLSAYQCGKIAAVRLTEVLAEELRPYGIDSNAIAPGPLNTRLVQQVLDAGPERAGAEFYQKNLRWSRGEAVSPRLAAQLAVYLASEASDGITGKLIAAQWDPWDKLQEFKEDLRSDIYTMRRIVPKDRSKTWGDR
jgi:3-oxoacyl-[acyl-carrier protein] reductase